MRVSTSVQVRVATTIIVLATTSPPRAAIAQDSARAEANAAVAKFQDHLDQFSFMTCEYDYTKAKASSIADAVAGKWMPRQSGDTMFPNTARVRLVKDGKNIRYEMIPDEDTLKIRRDGSKSATPDPKNHGLLFGPVMAFDISTELYNGADSLRFVPGFGSGMNSVNLHGKGVSVWSEEMQQGGLFLNVIHEGGKFSLAKLASTTQKPIEVRRSSHSGIDCVWLAIHQPNGHKREFALDPARGHLPRCIIWSDEKGTELSRCEVTDIKECSNGRFFPMRIITYSTKNRGFWLASEYKVTILDVDSRPSRESLMLDLPAGTAVSDLDREEVGKVNPTIFLKQNERIHPDEIPKLRDLIARKQEQPLADTALHPPGTSWWKWALGGVGVALVLVAAVWRVRSRRALGAA